MSQVYKRYIVVSEHQRINVVSYSPYSSEQVITLQEKEELTSLFYMVPYYGKKNVFEIKDRFTIKATSIVGAIKLSTGTIIEVLPKFSTGELSDPTSLANHRTTLLQMILLSRNDNPIFLESTSIKDNANEIPLLENFVLLFAKNLVRALLKGLENNYHLVEKQSHYVKGKILLQKQLRAGVGNMTNIYIQCDEFSENNPLMQFFKASVRYLLNQSEFSFITKNALTEALYLLNDVDEVRLSLLAPTIFTFNRNNERFSNLYSQCIHIISKYYPYTSSEKGDDLFSILYNMDELYEKFLAFLFERDQIAFREQDRLDAYSRGYKKDVYGKPDFVFLTKGNLKNIYGVGDAKWKLLNKEEKLLGISAPDFWQVTSYMNLADDETVPGYFFIPTNDSKSSEYVFLPAPNAKKSIKIFAISFKQPIEKLLSTTSFIAEDNMLKMVIKQTEQEWVKNIFEEFENLKEQFANTQFSNCFKLSKIISETMQDFFDYTGLGIKEIADDFAEIKSLIFEKDGLLWTNYQNEVLKKSSNIVAVSKSFRVIIFDSLVKELDVYRLNKIKNTQLEQENISVEKTTTSKRVTTSANKEDPSINPNTNEKTLFEFIIKNEQPEEILLKVINTLGCDSKLVKEVASLLVDQYSDAKFFKMQNTFFELMILLCEEVKIPVQKLQRAMKYIDDNEANSLLKKIEFFHIDNAKAIIKGISAKADKISISPYTLRKLLSISKSEICDNNIKNIVSDFLARRFKTNLISDNDFLSLLQTENPVLTPMFIRGQLYKTRPKVFWEHFFAIAIGEKNKALINLLPSPHPQLQEFSNWYLNFIESLDNGLDIMTNDDVQKLLLFKNILFHPSSVVSHTWYLLAKHTPSVEIIKEMMKSFNSKNESVFSYVVFAFLRNQNFIHYKDTDIFNYRNFQLMIEAIAEKSLSCEPHTKEKIFAQLASNWNKNDNTIKLIIDNFKNNKEIIQKLCMDKNAFYGTYSEDLQDLVEYLGIELGYNSSIRTTYATGRVAQGGILAEQLEKLKITQKE